ncbi:MAG: hypothetical protein ACLUIX_04905 [Oscillospiraceae bacterium]
MPAWPAAALENVLRGQRSGGSCAGRCWRRATDETAGGTAGGLFSHQVRGFDWGHTRAMYYARKEPGLPPF